MDPDGKFFFSLIFGSGIVSMIADIAFGGILGVVAGGRDNWGEGFMTGVFAGALSTIASTLQIGLTELTFLVKGGKVFHKLSLLNRISLFASVGLHAATQTELLIMHPNVTGEEGPWPLFMHHGALGSLVSGAGGGLNLLEGGLGYVSEIVGIIASLEDFSQHTLQLGTERYRSPFNKLYSSGWFGDNIPWLLGSYVGLSGLSGWLF